MPVDLVKSLAEKTGKSIKEVERLWKEAKKVVSEQYPDIPTGDERYWKLVTGVLKKMLSIKDDVGMRIIRKLKK